MDLLRSFTIFTEVARLQSFSAAAEKLGLSVAAVSRRVKELEDWCGLQLLNRTTRRVSLTHEGKRYFDHIRELSSQVDQLEQALREDRLEPSGRLRITAPVFISYHFLTPILPNFLERYPKIDLELDVLDRRVDMIAEGYDLAIRVGVLDDVQLHARKLIDFGLKLVASPSYVKEQGAPEDVDSLVNHSCLVDTVPRFAEHWPLLLSSGEPLGPVPTKIRVNNGDIIRELAVAGSGIALLPDWMVSKALCRGDLVELLPGSASFDAGIYAVYPYRRHSSINIRAFVDFLIEHQHSGLQRLMVYDTESKA